MKWPQISEAAWRGATVGVLLFSILVYLFEVFGIFAGVDVLFYGSLTALGGIVCIALLALLAVLCLRLLMQMPWYYQAAAAGAIIIVDVALPADSTPSILFTLFLLVVCPSLIGGSAARLLADQNGEMSKGHRNRLLLGIAMPALILAGSSFLLFSEGAMDETVVHQANTEKVPLDLPDPSLPGPYAVKQLFYGSGTDYYRKHFGADADLTTASVDGSPFVTGWDGWTGWIRTYFWGFDAGALPLNGQVWYPEGSGPFPLVLIVHGNHIMSDFSDSGYGYLGNLLASQGFIAVSVDENFLNSNLFDLWSAFDEPAARGWLLLKHLSAWRGWNETPENPFYRKVDMDNIGLIGHSRGGEAVITAKAFNGLPFYPDDGTVAFDFNFSIKALAAIAAKDGQYLPAQAPTPLENVNYFVMHGSHDGDVRSFEGTKAYSRLVFNDGNYWFKAALYIIGANHGQFNDVWKREDASFPDSLLLNVAPLLSNEQQHKVAEVYLSSFLKAALKNEEQYIPLFWDARLGKSWLPDTLFLSQFQDSKTAFVYSRKQDLDLTKASLPGVTISESGLTLWRLQKVTLKRNDKLDNAIFAGWKDRTGSLSIGLPKENSIILGDESALTFSLADAHESPEKGDSDYTPSDEPIDFTIELADSSGEKAILPLSADSYLFPQIQAKVYKADFLDTAESSEPVFQTFRFPLGEFKRVNSKLDIGSLRTIRFLFDKTPSGVVIIDNIGFNQK